MQTMAKDQPTLPYRPCVGVCLINADGLIWLGRRAGLEAGPDAGAWQMPQGGIDDGESADVAVLRELQEEIGTAQGTIIAKISDWLPYDFPDFVPKKMRAKWRGQTQKWFLLRFTGQDSDIDVRGVAHPEFSAWRWATTAEAIALVVPFKRSIYEQVLHQFSDHLSSRSAKIERDQLRLNQSNL